MGFSSSPSWVCPVCQAPFSALDSYYLEQHRAPSSMDAVAGALRTSEGSQVEKPVEMQRLTCQRPISGQAGRPGQ